MVLNIDIKAELSFRLLVFSFTAMEYPNKNKKTKTGKGGEDGKGFGVLLDLGYDQEDEYSKPGYTRSPELVFSHYGGSSELRMDLGGFRNVNTDGPIAYSAEALAPHVSYKMGFNENGFHASSDRSAGKFEFHAGDVGGKIEGPSVSYNLELSKNGVNAHYENQSWSASVNVGSVTASIGIGTKAAVRVESSGVGAIVPPYGGGIISEDGIEVSCGAYNCEVNWSKEIKEKEK